MSICLIVSIVCFCLAVVVGSVIRLLDMTEYDNDLLVFTSDHRFGITITLFAISLLFLVWASTSATKDVHNLAERRKIMAQNGAITQRIEFDDITSFNKEVTETYSKIPSIDKKLFLRKEESEKLMLIPYDEQWYKSEIAKEGEGI